MAPSKHIIRGSDDAVKPDERFGKKNIPPEPSKPRRRPGGKAELRGLIRMSEQYLALSDRARIVFDALLDDSSRFAPDDQGGEVMECFSGRKRIARRVGRSIAYVDRGLAELRKARLVVSVNNQKKCGKHNVYSLYVPPEIIAQRYGNPCPESVEPTPQPCGVDARNPDASNASDLQRSLDPVLQIHEKQEPPTTTTHAEKTRPAGSGGGGGGGGRVCASDEQKNEAIAELKRRGVGAVKAIRRELDAGHLTVEQIEAVLWYVDRQDAESGPGLIVTLLLHEEQPEIVEDFRRHIEQERTSAERDRQLEIERAERERRDQAERVRREQIAAQQQAERAALAVDRGRFEEQRKQANARELHAENLRRIAEADDDAIIGAVARLVLSADHPWELIKVLGNSMHNDPKLKADAGKIRALAERLEVVAFWIDAELRQELRRKIIGAGDDPARAQRREIVKADDDLARAQQRISSERKRGGVQAGKLGIKSDLAKLVRTAQQQAPRGTP